MLRNSIGFLFAALGSQAAFAAASEESTSTATREPEAKSLEQPSFDDITEKLKPLWKEQHEKLETRQEEMNLRCRRLQKMLNGKNDTLATFLKRWNAAVDQFTKRNGMVVTSMDVYYALLKRIEGILQRSEATLDGEDDNHIKQDSAFHDRYGELLKRRNELEALHKITLMTESDGRRIGLFPGEKNRNTSLTHTEYIDSLARLLYTPERLALFLRYFVEYTYDSPDPDADPLKKGTIHSFGEHWQTPEETLNRTENGKMLGDCEDQAILLKEILLRQKKKPFIILIEGNPTGHATCVSIEKNEEGKFDVFDFGTHGLDRNGAPWGINSSGVTVGVGYGAGPQEFLTGFTTPKEALSAMMKKYERWMSMNMKEWHESPGIFVAKDWSQRDKDMNGNLKHTDDRLYLAFERLHEFVSEVKVAPLPPPE